MAKITMAYWKDHFRDRGESAALTTSSCSCWDQFPAPTSDSLQLPVSVLSGNPKSSGLIGCTWNHTYLPLAFPLGSSQQLPSNSQVQASLAIKGLFAPPLSLSLSFSSSSSPFLSLSTCSHVSSLQASFLLSLSSIFPSHLFSAPRSHSPNSFYTRLVWLVPGSWGWGGGGDATAWAH